MHPEGVLQPGYAGLAARAPCTASLEPALSFVYDPVSSAVAVAVGGGTLLVVLAFGVGSIGLGWLTLRFEAKR